MNKKPVEVYTIIEPMSQDNMTNMFAVCDGLGLIAFFIEALDAQIFLTAVEPKKKRPDVPIDSPRHWAARVRF